MTRSQNQSTTRRFRWALAVAAIVAFAATARAGEVPISLCGNEVLEPGEQCDDGGTQNGDCCSSTCQFESPGAACADEDYCNGAETCDGQGHCQAGTPPVCNDNNPCTNDICNSLGQNCLFLPNSLSCDDGNPCTVGDTCSGSSCQPGSTPLDCNDDNECTDDVCTDFVGCEYDPNTGPCDDGDACTTGTVCAAGQCVGGAAVICDDGSSCTTDTCDPLSGCFYQPTVESAACQTCGDGTDNDNDSDIDAEDDGCATLAPLQRFAVLATRPTGNDHIYSGSDVLVDSTGGNQNLPYPSGQSRAGMCAYALDIRGGTNVGLMAVETKVDFGQGSTLDRDIDVREEFVSDAITIKNKTKPPYVGPGACSNNALQSCVEDLDCGMGTCDGRQRLGTMNPFVDMTGTADNFERCQNAISDLEPIAAAIALIPATPVGTLLGNADNDVVTNAATPLVQIPLGSGLQVIAVRDLHVGPATEVQIVGQPDTTLVVQLSRKMRLGADAKVTLLGGLTADHVLWNVTGSAGGHPDFAGDSQFAGTVLAPNRSLIRTGAAVIVDGALFGKKVHLSADTSVTHVPFTPLLP